MFPLKDNLKTSHFPFITLGLIMANVLMYFLFQKGGIFHGPSDANVVNYGAIPYELTHPGKHCEIFQSQILCEGQPGVQGHASGQISSWLTPFTAMFMHGGILHLMGNMVFLWVFGNTLEDRLGKMKFLAFYLLAGVAALVAQVIVSPDSTVPTIGASGAIAGVLGGYVLLFPRARVLTVIFFIIIFTVLELPALFMLGLWFLEQIAFGYFDLTTPTGSTGGVAYFAHIGGFIFGLLFIKIFFGNGREKLDKPPQPPAPATIGL
jgi:membrane associated rhomboid family serine protease